MKVNLEKLCRMAVQLPPLGELEVLLDNWCTDSPLLITHGIWQKRSFLFIGGKNFTVTMLNVPPRNCTSFAVQLKKKLSGYLGNEPDSIEVTRKPIADVAFTLQGDIDRVIREELIKLIQKAENDLKIPEHDSGNFSLAMLDQEYDVFFFESASLEDDRLIFYGTTDLDDKSWNISEDELPDKGLLYIYDYLTTGAY